MVPNYPDQETRTTDNNEAGGTATTLSYYDYPVYSTVLYDVPVFEVKKKIQCFFIAFVLFLVAHRGILPNPCRDIRNDETPYGFE